MAPFVSRSACGSLWEIIRSAYPYSMFFSFIKLELLRLLIFSLAPLTFIHDSVFFNWKLHDMVLAPRRPVHKWNLLALLMKSLLVSSGPVMTKFTIALREIGTYKEVLRSQVKIIFSFCFGESFQFYCCPVINATWFW